MISFNRLDELVSAPRSWVHLFRGRPFSPQIGTPLGIAYRDPLLYICDTGSNYVHIWDLADGSGRRIGGELTKPVAVAVDDARTIYVADTSQGAVLSYNASGKLEHRYKLKNRQQFRPVAITLIGSRLYVANLVRHRIEMFSTVTHEHVGTIGQAGSSSGQFYFPSGLTGDHQGWLYVSDMMNSRIQVFDRDGNFIRTFGRPGHRYGSLGKPKGIAVGPDGTVFIADAEFSHVHLFDSDGRLLMLLGGPQDEPGGTPLPNSVAVTHQIPAQLIELVPSGIHPSYYVWVANTTGRKRLALFAVIK